MIFTLPQTLFGKSAGSWVTLTAVKLMAYL